MAAATGEAARQAVREGDLDAVRAFLDAGVDANLSNAATGRTLLHIACRQGFAAIASLLLSNGANPGAKTFRQLTPLHLACHQGHPKVARLVLEAWAPVDDRDEAGTAPLHLCAQMGHGEVVRLLLQCGANKDARDESGWTPIFFASWKGHAAVARLLLQAGADARAFDARNNITPLHLACSWGKLEVAKVLIEFGADSSAKDCNGAFPDGVIGAGSPDPVDPACARELSEVILGHRLRLKEASSSLECVVDSLRTKVSELENQLERAARDRSELLAYHSDENRQAFLAAVKPECPLCQVEVKEAVLDPCRHLAACCSCASRLQSCPVCLCPVGGYQLLESRTVYEHVLAMEDELAGLKSQLQRFSRRVRDLVSENGDLKVELGRAKAVNLVLETERRSLEERFLFRPSLIPETTPLGETAPDNGRRSTASAPRSAKIRGGEGVTRGKYGFTVERSTSDSIGGGGGIVHGMGGGLGQRARVVTEGRTSSGRTSLDESKAAAPGVSGPRKHFGRPAGKDSTGSSADSFPPRSLEGAPAPSEADGDDKLSKIVGGVDRLFVGSASVGGGDSHRGKAHDADGCASSERSSYAGGARPSPSDGTYDTSDLSERDTPHSRWALGTPTICEQERGVIDPAELRDGGSDGERGAGAGFGSARGAHTVGLGSERRSSSSRNLPSKPTRAYFGSEVSTATSAGEMEPNQDTERRESTSPPAAIPAAGGVDRTDTRSESRRIHAPAPIKESNGSDDASGSETESGIWPFSGSDVVRVDAEDFSDEEHGVTMRGGAAAGDQGAIGGIDRPAEKKEGTGESSPTTRRDCGHSTHDRAN